MSNASFPETAATGTFVQLHAVASMSFAVEGRTEHETTIFVASKVLKLRIEGKRGRGGEDMKSNMREFWRRKADMQNARPHFGVV